MSCSSLCACSTLWCINLHFNACMAVFFHLSFILGLTTLGKSVMAVFLVVLAGPCSPFASLSSCQILLGPGRGSRLLLHFGRPITALRSGGSHTTSQGSRKCGSTGAALLGNGRPNWGNDANWEKKKKRKIKKEKKDKWEMRKKDDRKKKRKRERKGKTRTKYS